MKVLVNFDCRRQLKKRGKNRTAIWLCIKPGGQGIVFMITPQPKKKKKRKEKKPWTEKRNCHAGSMSDNNYADK